MKVENGQITRFVEVPEEDGSYSLAVECVTAAGPVLGRLHAPQNATAGYVRFRPDASLQHLAGTAFEGEEPPNYEGVGVGGAVTTDGVPTKGKPSKDDPRGLKRGRG